MSGNFKSYHGTKTHFSEQHSLPLLLQTPPNTQPTPPQIDPGVQAIPCSKHLPHCPGNRALQPAPLLHLPLPDPPHVRSHWHATVRESRDSFLVLHTGRHGPTRCSYQVWEIGGNLF